MGPVINWISRHAFFGPAFVLSTPSQWRRALRSSGSACLAAPANEVPLLNVDSTTIPNILSGLECGVVVNLSRLYSGYVKAMSICLVVLILSDASCRFAASSSAACLSSSICSRPSLHAVTCGIVMEWQPLQKDTKGSRLCWTADRAVFYAYCCRIPSVLFKFSGKLHTSQGQVAEESLSVSGPPLPSCGDPPTARPSSARDTSMKEVGCRCCSGLHVTIWGNAENSVKLCIARFNTMTLLQQLRQSTNIYKHLQTLEVVTPATVLPDVRPLFSHPENAKGVTWCDITVWLLSFTISKFPVP